MQSAWRDRIRYLVFLFIALGIAERAAWNALRPTLGTSGEATRVALALGSGRGFADAYRAGQGPTAHLLPVSPGIAGAAYAIFGPGSLGAEFILAIWSIGLAMTTYLLLYSAFGKIGCPQWARLAALGYGCLAPAYIGQEAVDFRVWDGGLATCLLALFVERLVTALGAGRLTNRFVAGMGALLAALFFVNPTVGFAAVICSAACAMPRLPTRQRIIAAGTSALVVSVLVVPWALRNDRVLGAPVLLRSNAGLELALANYPDATVGGDHRQQFLDRLAAIHPSFGEKAYRAMLAAGGEVPYAKMLGETTKHWMIRNPGKAAQLMALHVRQALFPQPWQFDVFARSLSPALRALLVDFAAILGVVGLVMGIARGNAALTAIAVIVAVWGALSAPFQPVMRYTYIVYPFMVFCAFDGLSRLVDAVRKRVTSSVQGT